MSSTKSLPKELKDEISQFKIDGFAKKYFQTVKKGIFRRTVPMEKRLNWSKDLISSPLLVLNKAHQKDAIKCFKQLQRIMGDRSGSVAKGHKTATAEDYQFICEKGILFGELRDEIYVQICKQLTGNPNENSIKAGWELMAVVLVQFPPSKNFEAYLKSFLIGHLKDSKSDIKVLSKYCLSRFNRILRTGPKGKVPTLAEVERALKAPYHPSVFGEALYDIMKMDNVLSEKGNYPKIVDFLSDAIVNLGGLKSEGLFRVPGDVDSIAELKLSIENGKYEMGNISDPNVPASLLKFWLRDLADPLIPSEFYDRCTACSEKADELAKILKELPEENYNVVKFIVNFLRLVARPEHQAITKMNINNLSMVFAPNFLRCPSDNPQVIFENTRYEQMFLRTLITNKVFADDE